MHLKIKRERTQPTTARSFSHHKALYAGFSQDLSPNYYDLAHEQSLHDYYDKKKRTILQANSHKNFIKFNFYPLHADVSTRSGGLPDLQKHGQHFSCSLLFILNVLGTYFFGRLTIDALCFRFGISRSQLYKWLKLWEKQKSEWLGILKDLSTPDRSFFDKLYTLDAYSSFTQAFVRRFAVSAK